MVLQLHSNYATSLTEIIKAHFLPQLLVMLSDQSRQCYNQGSLCHLIKEVILFYGNEAFALFQIPAMSDVNEVLLNRVPDPLASLKATDDGHVQVKDDEVVVVLHGLVVGFKSIQIKQ